MRRQICVLRGFQAESVSDRGGSNGFLNYERFTNCPNHMGKKLSTRKDSSDSQK
jgi:hypothetical protein